MTVERFQPEAVVVTETQIVDIIRNTSIVRKLYPQENAVTIKDSIYKYPKLHEQSNVQYGFEIQRAKYNEYATEKVPTAIPLHQGDLAMTRHDVMRASADIASLDLRILNTIEDLVADEERTGIFGSTEAANTILHDTTNISTAATAAIDMGTFIEASQTFGGVIAQQKALLKNKFKGCKLKYLATTDVEARMHLIHSTTSEEVSIYDDFAKKLADINGGGLPSDNMFFSDYLGSETAEGTTNSALIAKDPRNMKLITSPIEITQGKDPLENLVIQIAFRSRPVFFRGNDTVIYDAGTVLTA